MRTENNRAFKEWAVACEAMEEGRQILLVRKGGIREEEGVFALNDPEFFLLPTYEHQNAELLRPEFVPALEAIQARGHDPKIVTIDSYAVADAVVEAKNEEQVRAVGHECIWNETYVKLRFDFNPYDPLYLIVLRVYRLAEAVSMPMTGDYGGCKSWVTLERSISTAGAVPAIADGEFERRRDSLVCALRG